MQVLLDRERAVLKESNAFIENLKSNIHRSKTELARMNASILEHTGTETQLLESLAAIRLQIQDLEAKEAGLKAQTAKANTGLTLLISLAAFMLLAYTLLKTVGSFLRVCRC